MELIIALSTSVITLLCGIIAKKISWFNNKLIPIQNLLIGTISSIIYFLFTKDFNLAITTAGLLAGGAYDIVNNLNKIINT